MHMIQDNYEYSRQQISNLWKTSIALQSMDHLHVSDHLKKIANRHIIGDISIEDAEDLLEQYYLLQVPGSINYEEREADFLAQRCVNLLMERAFSLSANEYVLIHKNLFSDLKEHSGKCRHNNLLKRESLLNGASIFHRRASEVSAALKYEIEQEVEYIYEGLSMREIIHHLAIFVSSLWQIHVFEDGNTKTTIIFFLKYLSSLGFDICKDTFANNADYFRAALVRANYNDLKNGICSSADYLEMFLRNLLLGEHNELCVDRLSIKEYSNANRIDVILQQSQKKAYEADQPIITDLDLKANNYLSRKTYNHIALLKQQFGDGIIFGRTEVINSLGLTASPASDLIKKMLHSGIIEAQKGHGKGKYTFVQKERD